MKEVIRIADRILYEDGDLLVVNKPAGIDSQSSSSFRPDMVSLLKNHFSAKENGTSSGQKGGRKEPYIGVVHRLDQPVEGLMLYARNPKAAALLSKMIESRKVKKIYYALVFGTPSFEENELCDLLETDRRTHRARVVSVPTPEAKKATLSFRNVSGTCESDARMEELRRAMGEDPVSVVRVSLGTGRFHQIRVQLSHAGYPLVGDRRYGPDNGVAPELLQKGEAVCKTVALCSMELAFLHPVTGKKMEFSIRRDPQINKE